MPDRSFTALLRKERDWIDGVDRTATDQADKLTVSKPGAAGEPWVEFTSRDRFGIALSGGGIRSATFNLGLLQAFERHGILREADYLSTVSGGSYIAGFLSAWRHRQNGASSFPMSPEPKATKGAAQPADVREPPPIRHLREFSRFLIPRSGPFHRELWNAIVTIVGGLVPSLTTACAVLTMGMMLWLVATYMLSSWTPELGAAAIGGFTLLVITVSEYTSRRKHTQDWREIAGGVFGFPLYGVLASAWLAFTWVAVGHRHETVAWAKSAATTAAPWLEKLPMIPPDALQVDSIRNYFDLWSDLWILPAGSLNQSAIGGAYAPAVAWLGTAAVLLVIRTICSRFEPERREGVSFAWTGTLDRIVTVFLALGALWTVMASLWLGARLLYYETFDWHVQAGLGVATAAGGTAGLFAWLRDWLSKPSELTRAETLVRKAAQALRSKIPQALAIIAVVLLMEAVCLLLLYCAGHAHTLGAGLLPVFVVAGLILLLTLVCFDPARVGMHDFYRARVARCFLGAARATEHNFCRGTAEIPSDDLTLGELRDRTGDGHRTLHLICCTANNLSGDMLSGLYRGGRSAVLSPHGIALGDYHASLDSLRLSSALTASAAAFNSQMGRRSVDYGPAVGFMMCALNLRLGLWVPHPLNPARKVRLSGLPFFYEMFGLTDCDAVSTGDTQPRASSPTEAGGAAPQPESVAESSAPKENFTGFATRHIAEGRNRFRALHLSDGGHFENLGLYELVRRHCRYIIVSDCGADEEVLFDDLAIALRTIREDFGVEIDLDVSPLRPDENGKARQHAVIGTIHYNGLSGLDKGTLLYFKPTLTGDEPPDVLQYRSRNPAFPHESTGDQFYDEAQWESYRRLGQHAGNVVLRFLESMPQKHGKNAFVDAVFLEASRLWHPAPERQIETFLSLTARCVELENEIRANGPAFLRREFFPEAAAAVAQTPSPMARDTTTVDDETQALYFLMLVMQLMEDVFVGAELEGYWSHPLNDGWMNYFHRWAATPSFRRWWPILSPIYSIGFREFVRERFALRFDDRGIAGPSLELLAQNSGAGLAWDYWRQRHPRGLSSDDKVLEYWLTLKNAPRSATPLRLLVGLLIYREDAAKGVVKWQSDHLFVPPSLNGAGIMTQFLDRTIAHFPHRRLQANFEADKLRMDPATRLSRVRELSFYKSRGFVSLEPAGETLQLVLDVRPVEERRGASHATAAEGAPLESDLIALEPLVHKMAELAKQNGIPLEDVFQQITRAQRKPGA